MSEATQTDVVDTSQNPQTDVVPAGNEGEPASSTDETSSTTDNTQDSLEFDQLLGRQKVDPNNKRGGLSRKEAAIAKGGEKPEEVVGDSELEAVKAELSELRSLLGENLNIAREAEAAKSKAKAESEFTAALEQAGVSVAEFNSQYKSDYISEFEDFLESGLSTDKAVQKALKVVLPKVQQEDSENRTSGRARAAIPPTSQPVNKTVFKESEIAKLASTDRGRYIDLMNKRDRGEIQVVVG